MFVAAEFQHRPVNMGYFAQRMAETDAVADAQHPGDWTARVAAPTQRSPRPPPCSTPRSSHRTLVAATCPRTRPAVTDQYHGREHAYGQPGRACHGLEERIGEEAGEAGDAGDSGPWPPQVRAATTALFPGRPEPVEAQQDADEPDHDVDGEAHGSAAQGFEAVQAGGLFRQRAQRCQDRWGIVDVGRVGEPHEAAAP
ncbi:hypothetical protein BH23ACT6_BH23ACT6_23690 [soil metagenome]